MTGKMGAGKTTYAKKISQDKNIFFLSEDEILFTLFPDQLHSLKDYVTFSNKIKPFVLNLNQTTSRKRIWYHYGLSW